MRKHSSIPATMGIRIRTNLCHEIRHVKVIEVRNRSLVRVVEEHHQCWFRTLPTPEERTRHEVEHVLFRCTRSEFRDWVREG